MNAFFQATYCPLYLLTDLLKQLIGIVCGQLSDILYALKFAHYSLAREKATPVNLRLPNEAT